MNKYIQEVCTEELNYITKKAVTLPTTGGIDRQLMERPESGATYSGLTNTNI